VTQLPPPITADMVAEARTKPGQWLHAFTSRRWLPANWAHWQVATGRDLRNANLGRAALRLNPDVQGAVSLTVPLS
jgi:hypothetical protein